MIDIKLLRRKQRERMKNIPFRKWSEEEKFLSKYIEEKLLSKYINNKEKLYMKDDDSFLRIRITHWLVPLIGLAYIGFAWLWYRYSFKASEDFIRWFCWGQAAMLAYIGVCNIICRFRRQFPVVCSFFHATSMCVKCAYVAAAIGCGIVALLMGVVGQLFVSIFTFFNVWTPALGAGILLLVTLYFIVMAFTFMIDYPTEDVIPIHFDDCYDLPYICNNFGIPLGAPLCLNGMLFMTLIPG